MLLLFGHHKKNKNVVLPSSAATSLGFRCNLFSPAQPFQASVATSSVPPLQLQPLQSLATASLFCSNRLVFSLDLFSCISLGPERQPLHQYPTSGPKKPLQCQFLSSCGYFWYLDVKRGRSVCRKFECKKKLVWKLCTGLFFPSNSSIRCLGPPIGFSSFNKEAHMNTCFGPNQLTPAQITPSKTTPSPFPIISLIRRRSPTPPPPPPYLSPAMARIPGDSYRNTIAVQATNDDASASKLYISLSFLSEF